MPNITVKQRKVQYNGKFGPKTLTIEYSKQARYVFRAFVEPVPNNHFANACPTQPRGDKIEIDAGVGDLFLFDPRREVLWATSTGIQPGNEVTVVDDSRGHSGDDLESLMTNLLD